MSEIQLRGFDDPTYDPFTSDEINFGDHRDPYPQIAAWREQGPVIEGAYRTLFGMPTGLATGGRYFVVVGSDEINTALTDAARFSNAAYRQNLGATFGLGSISVLDGPEHGRWRRIFQQIFLPRRVNAWSETLVDPVVDKLMRRFIPRGEADLVEEFTRLFPFEVIYSQLDLPERDIAAFQRLAIGQTDYMNADKAIEAGVKLGEYFKALTAARRARPGEDLVSQLATTEVDGEHLPELVLVSFLRQLMNAAGDTTYRGASVLLTALLQNPDQLAALRADRGLVPQAIEEALRWDGPVTVQTRMAEVDTELGGVLVPAGSVLDVVAAAQNRDPALYPDPDRFDIFRERRSHASFSRGPHICVGQHLARVEMARALNAVLDRLAGLRLDPDRPRPEIRGVMMRAPKHLYVRFDRGQPV